MFSDNQGDYYFEKVISKDEKDQNLAASCVRDSKTDDIIVKMVNFGSAPKPMKINLSQFGSIASQVEQTVLSGDADAENTLDNPQKIVPVSSTVKIGKLVNYSTPAMSLTVIRIKTKK